MAGVGTDSRERKALMVQPRRRIAIKSSKESNDRGPRRALKAPALMAWHVSNPLKTVFFLDPAQPEGAGQAV